MLSSELNKDLILLLMRCTGMPSKTHTQICTYICKHRYILLYLAQHHNFVRNHIIFKPDNQKWKNNEKHSEQDQDINW